jgi:hypothetical protein
MPVAVALEELARESLEPLAGRWWRARLRVGDHVGAMRAMKPTTRDDLDVFVIEVLVMCLERANADHRETLWMALHYVRAERSASPSRRRRRLAVGLIMVALGDGEEVEPAKARAAAAFGSRSATGLRRRPPSRLPWAILSTAAFTLAWVGLLVVSTELALAGW